MSHRSVARRGSRLVLCHKHLAMETMLGRGTCQESEGHGSVSMLMSLQLFIHVLGHVLHSGPPGLCSSVSSMLVAHGRSRSCKPCSALLEWYMISSFPSCVIVTIGGNPGPIAARQGTLLISSHPPRLVLCHKHLAMETMLGRGTCQESEGLWVLVNVDVTAALHARAWSRPPLRTTWSVLLCFQHVVCTRSESFLQSAPCSAHVEWFLISAFPSCVILTTGACGNPGPIAGR